MYSPAELNEKARAFTFSGYAESLPDDWTEILEDTLLPFALIWHDRDTYTDKDLRRALRKGRQVEWLPGDTKKLHAHVIITFPNTTTLKHCLKVLDPIAAGISKVEAVRTFEGSCKYLTHENYPEKAQYDRTEIQTFNDFKLDFGDEKEQIQNERSIIFKFIIENEITEFMDLMKYVLFEHPEWEETICFYTYQFKTLIDSIRHSKGQRLTDQVAEAELKRREEAKKQLIAAAAEADLGSLGDYYQDDSQTRTNETDDEISERIFMTFVIDHQVHRFEDLAGAAAAIHQEDKPNTKRFQNFIREFIITQPETYLSDLIKKAWAL